MSKDIDQAIPKALSQPGEDGNKAPAIGTQKVSVHDHRDGLFAAASAHVVPRRVYISLESEGHSRVGRHRAPMVSDGLGPSLID